jgi:hypothetical protein
MTKNTQKTQNNILSHNFTGNSLVLVFKSKVGKIVTSIVDKSHVNWLAVLKAYKAGQLNKVADLIDVSRAIQTKSNGKFAVKNGSVYRGDEKLSGYLVERILFFLREGLEYTRLLKFAENLYQNPSQETVTDLYKFLEHGNFPITNDGCFLAYKGVQSDFYSITGGTLKLIKGSTNLDGRIYNGVGEVIEVDRTSVNPNRDQTCSYGLHAGSHSYASDFGKNGKLVIVKINPKDVVSIPTDCNQQKLRTCKYEVIAEENAALDEARDRNFDVKKKVAVKSGSHSKRGPNGRFISAS